MRVSLWLSIIIMSWIVSNPSHAMIVRNKGEQTKAIENAAPFASVGMVGESLHITDVEVNSFTELFKILRSHPLEGQKELLEEGIKELFSQSVYERIMEIVAMNKTDLLTFFGDLILKDGVKIQGKSYDLKDFLTLLYKAYTLGLASYGTGTVIDPTSMGLDPKEYHNRLVFTAAHVVANEKSEYVFRLQPNKDNPNLSEYREYKVRHILFPKAYKHSTDGKADLGGNDFAVLILDKPIDLPIIPLKIKILDLKALLGRTVLSVGFGKTGYVGSDIITDYIRRAGHYLINYINPKTLIFGATTLQSPQNYLYGANPFQNSQIFFGHPFKGQAEFTPFNYNTALLSEVSHLSNDPSIGQNIRKIAGLIDHWEKQTPTDKLQEVNITYRYGPFKDQIIKYSRLPHVAVMTLQGDSGGPLMICENGIYYIIGVTFAGSVYDDDKTKEIKPEGKFCKAEGCTWASRYEKEELHRFLPAMKSKDYTMSLANNFSQLLPRLRQVINSLTAKSPVTVTY